MRKWLPLASMVVSACGTGDPPAAGIVNVRIDGRPVGAPIELRTPNGLATGDAMRVPHEPLQLELTIERPDQGQGYRYAVYWRNESSLFPEVDHGGERNALAEENWYGRSSDEHGGFKHAAPVVDGSIVCKAGITLASDPRNEFPGSKWARDPRTGSYSLLLVAVPDRTWESGTIPAAVRDIRTRDQGRFVEPYWFWLHGPGARLQGVRVLRIDDAMRLSAVPDLSAGALECGNGHADMMHFAHAIDPNSRWRNIPVVADLSGSTFGPRQHDSALCFIPREQWVDLLPTVSADPCGGIAYDSITRALTIRNPGCADGRLRKENTGVKTRRYYTYGRFLVHARLAPLLNDSDLWNGLTNAIWLIGTGPESGLRRPCEGGYMDFGYAGHTEQRGPTSSYSEIDFEIMKGMPLCPERTFPPIYPQRVADPDNVNAWHRRLPDEVLAQRGRVAVACTNWDLACPDPPLFAVGCHDNVKGGRAFQSFRWTTDYRAVTQKSMHLDSVLFGPDGCWFEITWRPTEILWRIGPSPDAMELVSYMNDRTTTITNLPMALVITQEFHHTAWWPGSPYAQEGVPFPLEDLVGRVMEVRVE